VALLFQIGLGTAELIGLPFVATVDLVQGDHEGGLAHFEQLDTF
jgi:hypothetical protein